VNIGLGQEGQRRDDGGAIADIFGFDGQSLLSKIDRNP
jgi:hypothetical protein